MRPAAGRCCAPLGVESRGVRTVLAYEQPLSTLVDEISLAGRDLWRGRATLEGLPFGRFRIVRIGYHQRTPQEDQTP